MSNFENKNLNKTIYSRYQSSYHTRSFNIIDMAIIIIAMAIAFTSLQPFSTDGLHVLDLYCKHFETIGYVAYIGFVDAIVRLIGPWITCLTFAFLVIRMRSPRPKFSLLMTRCGMAACAVASVVFLVEASMAIIPVGMIGIKAVKPYYYAYLCTIIQVSSTAVAAVWVYLVIGRKWVVGRHWLDRTGFILGILWCIIFAANTCVMFIQPVFDIKLMSSVNLSPADFGSNDDRVAEKDLIKQSLEFAAERKRMEELLEATKKQREALEKTIQNK